jgi:hypothetical protein
MSTGDALRQFVHFAARAYRIGFPASFWTSVVPDVSEVFPSPSCLGSEPENLIRLTVKKLPSGKAAYVDQRISA